MITNFANLSDEDKIKICNQTQSILAKHFPDSEYTITKDTLETGINFYKKMIDSFSGMVFTNEHAVIFYKKYNVNNFFDKENEFRRAIKEPHHECGNCMFVEFLCAKIDEGTIKDLETFFFSDSNIEFVMACRRGVIYLKQINELKLICSRLNGSMNFITSLAG